MHTIIIQCHKTYLCNRWNAVNQYQYLVKIPFSPWHQSVAGKGGAYFKAQRAERWIKPKMGRTEYNALNALKHLYEAGHSENAMKLLKYIRNTECV